MNHGFDCKETTYKVTFPSSHEACLRKLMFVLEGLMPEAEIEVYASGDVSSFIITVHDDLAY